MNYTLKTLGTLVGYYVGNTLKFVRSLITGKFTKKLAFINMLELTCKRVSTFKLSVWHVFMTMAIACIVGLYYSLIVTHDMGLVTMFALCGIASVIGAALNCDEGV